MKTYRIPPWFDGADPQPTLILDNLAGLRLTQRDQYHMPTIEILVIGTSEWTYLTAPVAAWHDGEMIATAEQCGQALIDDICAAIEGRTPGR